MTTDASATQDEKFLRFDPSSNAFLLTENPETVEAAERVFLGGTERSQTFKPFGTKRKTPTESEEKSASASKPSDKGSWSKKAKKDEVPIKRNLHLTKDKQWLPQEDAAAYRDLVDTADRMSSLILLPYTAAAFEAKLFSEKSLKGYFDFHWDLYESKLKDICNATISELVRPPIYIRNHMLILKTPFNCSCPLNVLFGSRAFDKGDAKSADGRFGTKGTRDSTSRAGSFSKTDGSSSFFGLGTGSSGSPFSSSSSSTQNRGKNETSTAPRGAGESSQYKDILCPQHVGVKLPSVFHSSDYTGFLPEMDLVYKYSTLKQGFKLHHVLTLYQLFIDGAEPCQFPLPYRLQTLGVVNLRDFELERYGALFGSKWRRFKHLQNADASTLVDVYSGRALFIATDREILIALVHTNVHRQNKGKRSISLGVIMRHKNPGLKVKQIVCHYASGRIFLMTKGSMLYEYQYQLGILQGTDSRGILQQMANVVLTGYHLVKKSLTRQHVYKLRGTVATGYDSDRDGSETPPQLNGRNSAWWDGRGNCLFTQERRIGSRSLCFWPPIIWKPFNVFVNESAFSSSNEEDSCKCSSEPCLKSNVEIKIKLVNTWDKSFFPCLGSKESVVCIDENRWLILVLDTTSGNVSVYKIASALPLEHVKQMSLDFGRIFPYSLQVFHLSSANISDGLRKLNHSSGQGESHSLKLAEILAAPVDAPEGVDLILVDTQGSRIFVGFTLKDSKYALCVKGYRSSVAQSPTVSTEPKPSSTFDSSYNPLSSSTSKKKGKVRYSFCVDYLFVQCEYLDQLQEPRIASILLLFREGNSICTYANPKPQSVCEEFWMSNQHVRLSNGVGDYPSGSGSTSTSASTAASTSTSQKPASTSSDKMAMRPLVKCNWIEWYDDLHLTLDIQEVLLHVYHKARGNEKQLIIVTNHNVYTLTQCNLATVLSLLLNNPARAQEIIKPPLEKQQILESKENIQKFVDVYKKDKLVPAEARDLEIIASCLYYLCWLFTPQHVFETMFKLQAQKHCDHLNMLLLNPDPNENLLLTSIGISYKLYRWSAPGCYSLGDQGGLERPITSPWCPFVIFGKRKQTRFNKVALGLTSPGIDGLLLYVAQLLKPIWVNAMFVVAPSCVSYASTLKTASAADINYKLGTNQQLYVGHSFNTRLILKLAKPVSQVRALLLDLKRIYHIAVSLLKTYHTVTSENINNISNQLMRLPSKLQQDIFEGLLTGHDRQQRQGNLSTLLFQRCEADIKALEETCTLLEIAQEYLASCLLMENNCILSELEKSASRLSQGVEMLPSKSPHVFEMRDLNPRLDPFVTPFEISFTTQAKPKSKFAMSLPLLKLMCKSNLLNLIYNPEFFRVFRIATWLGGTLDVSSVADYFFGHLFTADELVSRRVLKDSATPSS